MPIININLELILFMVQIENLLTTGLAKQYLKVNCSETYLSSVHIQIKCNVLLNKLSLCVKS